MDSVSLGNEVLTINPDTRVIEVPSDLLLGVETDNASERLYFQCPKTVGDNIDLSQFHIYIHYQNANNEKGKYLCEDVESESDNITFSWLIKEKAVMYKGQTKFIVCAKKTDTDTIVWNTTTATGNVLEGLNVDEDIVKQNDDVIEQILTRLDNIEQSGGTGDINSAKVTFTESQERTNIESQETLSTLFGKIKKWFSDLKTVAFTGSYSDLSNKPNIPTKTSDLTNDSNFLTEIPEEYITDTDLEGYAKSSDIPKFLPNPKALTFTGAVTGEYDGSSPLTINIQEGNNEGSDGELRLVKRIVLEEETNSVYFDKDENDLPFELEEFRIYILAKATSTNETDGNALICINTTSVSYKNYLTNRIEGLLSNQYDKLMWMHSIFLDNKWQTNHGIRNSVNTGSVNMQTSCMNNTGTFAKKAYSFTIGDNSANADWYFGIGTEIVLYGR